MDKKIRIIVADDNKEFCWLLDEFFSMQNDTEVVGVAYNGEKTLKLIKEMEADILILDMILPLLDGLKVMEEINKLQSNNINTIVLSALDNNSLVHKMEELGANCYLKKPINMDTLLEKIRFILKANN